MPRKPMRYRMFVTTVDTDEDFMPGAYENSHVRGLVAGSVLVAVKEALEEGAVTISIYAENLERN